MAAIINTNLQSMNAQRNLSKSQATLSTAMQRLSSGLRINSAKDDAAGLAISERMTTQTRGLTVAARNANDGISLAQTAEGALGSITTNLQRIRELAVQARNATNNAEDRAALNEEVQQLKEEINRIARDTSFNDTKLLDGTFSNMAFQVGANQGQTIDVNTIVNAKSDNLGEWKSVDLPATASAAKPTGTTTAAVPGTGTLTLGAAPDFAAGGTLSLQVNGRTLSVTVAALSDRDGLAGAIQTALRTELGSTALEVTATSDTAYAITANDKGAVSFAGAGTGSVNAQTPESVSFVAGSVTINGQVISYGAANSSTQRANDLAKAINGNSTLKDGGVIAFVQDGLLKLESRKDDLVIAGSTDTETGLANGTTDFTPGTVRIGFDQLDVLDPTNADNAILAMDAALQSVNSARASLGAIQSRFETTIENLNIANENLTASKSRIMDADFAAETARLSSAQVLQQAGTAMVAQANQVPQGVLQLLQG